MIKYITYRDTGEVTSLSDTPISITKLNQTQVHISSDDLKKMKGGYRLSYDGNLIFEKIEWLENEEQRAKKRQDFLKDIDIVQKATKFSDVKEILERLITKNYNQ